MKILIIGAGNMGRVYAESFINAQILDYDNLMILEQNPTAVQIMKREGYANSFSFPDSFITEADLVILAVKPQDASDLYSSIQPFMKKDQLVLSIMAGVSVASIREGLGTEKIIRAMPNMPARVSMGITVFYASSEVNRMELFLVQNVLNSTGKSIYVENEDLINSATALSGSGPAFIWYYMDCMIQAGASMGFSEAEAKLLVQQSFLGSIHMIIRSNLNCRELIDRVASRGGTTEAALEVFENKDLDGLIREGLEAAASRAHELGGD